MIFLGERLYAYHLVVAAFVFATGTATAQISDDTVMILDPDGNVLEEISMLDALVGVVRGQRLPRLEVVEQIRLRSQRGCSDGVLGVRGGDTEKQQER